MRYFNNEIQGYIDRLRCWDENLIFLLNGIRDNNSNSFKMPNLSFWPTGTEAKHSIISTSYEPIVQFELFEIQTEIYPENCENLLLTLLQDLKNQGCLVSWLEFEGGFGTESFFSDPKGYTDIYGISFGGYDSEISIRESKRQTTEWKELIDKAVYYFFQLYPDLKGK